MKVWELINELRKFDPSLEVLTEGCDCYGETAAVELHDFVAKPDYKEHTFVYITRPSDD